MEHAKNSFVSIHTYKKSDTVIYVIDIVIYHPFDWDRKPVKSEVMGWWRDAVKLSWDRGDTGFFLC